jgi:peptide/nickel transport system substrate-binding protein/oligopeptide transport system substrate-binding protein
MIGEKNFLKAPRVVQMKRNRVLIQCLFLFLSISVFLHVGFNKSTGEAKERETPSQGGTYHRPLEFMPRTLDPALTTDIYSVTVVQQLFDGLVQFDQDLNVIPALAKSWKITPDGLTYTFFLREGARFHNGREVTADDFIYSFTRIIDPKNKSIATNLLGKVSGFSEFQEGRINYVKGFRSAGKHIFEIKLSEPFYPFIAALGTIHFKIVPKEEIEKPGSDFSKNPIGTGPFRFVSMKEREEIILEANRDYFEGRPFLDKVVFKIFHGAPRETILKEFKEGTLDESFLPPEEIEAIAKARKYLFLKKPLLSLRFYGLNSRAKPLDSKDVRKAINLAIDKRMIISELHKNQFNLAKGILPPGMPGHDPKKDPYPYDEDLAKRFLARAGYGKEKAGPSVEIWAASRSEAAQREMNEIKSQLARIGIQSNIHYETNWPNFESMLRDGRAPMFVYAWYADFPDPDNFLGILFHSKSKNNYTAYHNPEVDRLLDKAKKERDYLKRMGMYRKIEEVVLDDAPIVPMINHLFQMAYQPNVKGIEVNALGGPYIPMKKIWLKKQE